MIQDVFNILASIGCSFIITKSKLFQPLREYFSKAWTSDLMGCPQCWGMWVGMIWSFDILHIKSTISYGFIVSLLCYIIEIYTDRLKRK